MNGPMSFEALVSKAGPCPIVRPDPRVLRVSILLPEGRRVRVESTGEIVIETACRYADGQTGWEPALPTERPEDLGDILDTAQALVRRAAIEATF